MAAKKNFKKSREAAQAKIDSALADMTQQVIDSIESDPGNWTKPWVSSLSNGLPINVATKNRYSGGNVFWLTIVSVSRGYSTNVWGTYKQWASVGGQVRKGSVSTLGMFYKPIRITEKKNGEEVEKTIPLLKSFPLFNADQVEGGVEIARERFNVEDREGVDPIEHAEEFFTNVGADLRFGGDQAFYAHGAGADYIQVPVRDDFLSSEAFYATLAHEHTHWTGGPARLNRTKGKHFGDEVYAREELVAELGSAFLLGYLGIDTEAKGCGNAAYLASWLKVLKSEPKALWSVAGDAAKALDFLVHEAGENGVEDDEDEEVAA